MWMGKQLSAAARLGQEENAGALLGLTTMGGACPAVLTQGEERALPLFAPGGIVWMPGRGENVLVIKGGSGRDETCVVGAEVRKAPEGMEPGELYLCSAGGASVHLTNDGSIALQGTLYINGRAYDGEGEE